MYQRGAADIGLGTTIVTCDAQRTPPLTTTKYLRGAAGIRLDTMIKSL
jgi:hypothetical protein